MRKVSVIISLLLAFSVMSFSVMSKDPIHSVKIVHNVNAGKPFIATCTGMNCNAGWLYSLWEVMQYGSYTTQGCTGIHTVETQPCEPCLTCRSVCATCSGLPPIEPATYEEHTFTVDKMSDSDAKAYGRQLVKDYPDGHDFNLTEQDGKAVITFRVFTK